MRYNCGMKTKSLTFLLALTLLFLFSGSVFGQEEVKKGYTKSPHLNKKEPLIKPYIGVGPLEACSEWSNQTYIGDFIQNSLIIDKSPETISEKNNR